MNTRLVSAVAGSMALCLSLGSGCPAIGPTYSQSDLSPSERVAIDGVTEACAALAQANGALQVVSDAPAASPAGQSGGFQFGTCPVATATLAVASGTFNLTLDFGTGCAALGLTDVTCSGSLTGAFNRTEKALNMTFNSLTCNSDKVTGSADVNYDRTDNVVTLLGRWDLGWVSGDDNLLASGGGTARYNRDTHTTTLTSFTGEIIDGAAAITVALANVQVSYLSNTNLIPWGGEATLTSNTTRKLVIRFQADSPTTGNVQVSIDDSRFFTVNLFQL